MKHARYNPDNDGPTILYLQHDAIHSINIVSRLFAVYAVMTLSYVFNFSRCCLVPSPILLPQFGELILVKKAASELLCGPVVSPAQSYNWIECLWMQTKF